MTLCFGNSLYDRAFEALEKHHKTIDAKFCTDIAALQDNSTFADFTIFCYGGQRQEMEFSVHRNIISAHSEYFAKACSDARCNDHIVLHEEDLAAAQSMVKFFYTRTYVDFPRPQDDKNARLAKTYAIADKYKVFGLKALVLRMLFIALHPELITDTRLVYRLTICVYKMPLRASDCGLKALIVLAWKANATKLSRELKREDYSVLESDLPDFLSNYALYTLADIEELAKVSSLNLTSEGLATQVMTKAIEMP